MHGTSVVDTLLGVVWLLISVSEVVVSARVVYLGLLSRFRTFFVYLVVDVLRSVLLQWLGSNPYSEIYRDFWIASEPAMLVLQCFVVVELYWALYKAYPGIHNFARVLIGVAVIIGLLVTFGTVRFDIGHISWQIPDLQRLFVAKRLVSSMLGILVFITMLFFPRAPSALNIIFHGWLLAGLFIAAAGGLFFANSGSTTEWPSLVFLTLQLMCFIGWVVLFRRTPPKPPPTSPEEMERIERWNNELLEIARWLTS